RDVVHTVRPRNVDGHVDVVLVHDALVDIQDSSRHVREELTFYRRRQLVRRRDLERRVVERLRVGGPGEAEEIRRPGGGTKVTFAGLIVVVAMQGVPSIRRGRRDDWVVHVGEIVRLVRQ